MDRFREEQRAFPCVSVCSMSVFLGECVCKNPRCVEGFFSLLGLEIEDS